MRIHSRSNVRCIKPVTNIPFTFTLHPLVTSELDSEDLDYDIIIGEQSITQLKIASVLPSVYGLDDSTILNMASQVMAKRNSNTSSYLERETVQLTDKAHSHAASSSSGEFRNVAHPNAATEEPPILPSREMVCLQENSLPIKNKSSSVTPFPLIEWHQTTVAAATDGSHDMTEMPFAAKESSAPPKALDKSVSFLPSKQTFHAKGIEQQMECMRVSQMPIQILLIQRTTANRANVDQEVMAVHAKDKYVFDHPAMYRRFMITRDRTAR